MGLLSITKKTDINEGVREYTKTDNAFLIDVRSPEEYREGHIPSAINVPLNNTGKVTEVAPDKNAILFVYCLSGARSQKAVNQFRKMGYADVRNIGGISSYRGPVE